MGVLKFDGVDDRVEFGTLAAAIGNLPTGAWTMATLWRRNTSATTDALGYLKLGASPGVTKAGQSVVATTDLSVDIAAAASQVTGTTWGTTDTWLTVVGKTTGTTAARHSWQNITAGTAMSHVNTGGTWANQVAADTLEIGSWQDADPFDGWIGLVAWWSGNMSDTNRALLGANKRTGDFWNSPHGAPVFLAELNVAGVAVVDIANNASGIAVTGTTLDAAETLSSWSFGPQRIQLVVGDSAALTAGDTAIRSMLQSLGFIVSIVDDSAAANVTGIDGVVISESISSANVTNKYDTVAVPVVVHDGALFADMRLGNETGEEVSQTQVTIANATHAIALGPYQTFGAGAVTICTSANLERNTTPPSGGVSVANIVATGATTLLACESGATLLSGTAPARRATAPASDGAAAVLNAAGTNLHKNIYSWAFPPPAPGTPPSPMHTPAGMFGDLIGQAWF